MKYIVITAKHHDGFSLFDSTVTDDDIIDATPFKRGGNRYKQTNTWDFPGSTEADFDRYFDELALPQVKELLTRYDVDLIWFDDIEMKSPDQNDHRWAAPGEIIRRLADIVSKGGNDLLNVGPTAEGLIPQPCIDHLREVGD